MKELVSAQVQSGQASAQVLNPDNEHKQGFEEGGIEGDKQEPKKQLKRKKSG